MRNDCALRTRSEVGPPGPPGLTNRVPIRWLASVARRRLTNIVTRSPAGFFGSSGIATFAHSRLVSGQGANTAGSATGTDVVVGARVGADVVGVALGFAGTLALGFVVRFFVVAASAASTDARVPINRTAATSAIEMRGRRCLCRTVTGSAMDAR